MKFGRIDHIRVGYVGRREPVARTIKSIIRLRAIDLVVIDNQSCYKGNPIFLYEDKYIYEDPEDPTAYVQIEIQK
jgi:hypothetical protein